MYVRFRVVMLIVLSVLCALPVQASGTPQEMVNMLVNAIPRDMIPANYRNEQRPWTSQIDETVRIRFAGPKSASISFELNHYPQFPKPVGELVKIRYQNRKPEEVLRRTLDYGEAGCHLKRINEIAKSFNLRLISHERIVVGWDKYILEVQISGHQRPKQVGYKKYEADLDFSEQDASDLLRKLARTTFDRLAGNPSLSWISVEQRHLTYDNARITVKAKASYPMIGKYERKDITLTVRVRGVDNHTQECDAYGPYIQRKGQDLYLEWSFETRKLGGDDVKVTLRDRRIESAASSAAMRFDYEHSLSTKFTMKRPVAEILVVNRWVAIMREEHSAVYGGVIVTSERKYHQPKDVDWLKTFAELMGEDTTRDVDFEANRIWEPVEDVTSHFVYEGDRIGLYGWRDETLLQPQDFRDAEAWRVWAESGTSSVVLEWDNGLKGQAIWNPANAMNSPTGGHFTVGASRGSSGMWKQTWKEWFGTNSKILAEQYVDKKVGEAKQGVIDWFLKREGITLPGMPTMPLCFVIFNLTAGDTRYHDLVYLQLESNVFVSTREGRMRVFTFEGSPKIVDPSRNINVTVEPGKMVTVARGSVSEPRTFTAADLAATRVPVSDVNVDQIDSRKDKQVKDIPELNADIVKFGFFEGPSERPSLEQRYFTNTFDAATTRYIYWHLELSYPARQSAREFPMTAIWYLPDGRELGRTSRTYSMGKGWTGSYHDSAWGDATAGIWPPGNYRMELHFAGRIIAQGSFTVTGSGDKEQVKEKEKEKKPVYDFTEWPMEYKLDVAINRVETTLGKSLTREHAQRLQRVLDLVKQAKASYMVYHGPDYTIYRGSTDPADCPHNLQKVLEICQFDLEQSEAAWQRSPRPPSMSLQEQQKYSEAIAGAVGAIQQAAREASTLGGWQTFTDANGISFQAPPEFNILNTGEFPFAVQARDAQDRVDRVVLVRKRAKPSGMSMQAFQNELIDEQRNKFKDFHDLQSWRQFPGLNGYWFTFRYTWDGRPIEAFFYQDPSAMVPLEIRYIGAKGSFNLSEAEQVIRSVTIGK